MIRVVDGPSRVTMREGCRLQEEEEEEEETLFVNGMVTVGAV